MDQRKLIKLGNSSFAIALPKDWVDKAGLKKGDDVFLEKNGSGEIIVMPFFPGIKNDKKISINLENKDSKSIKREIRAAYIKGYNILELKGVNEKNKKDEIKRILKDFLSFELTGSEGDNLLLKDFFSLEEANLSNFIRRMDNNIREILDIVIEELKKDKTSIKKLQEIEEIDQDVNKFYFLCSRIFMKGVDNPSVLTILKTDGIRLFNDWWFAFNLEALSDGIKYSLKGIQEKEKDVKKIKEGIYKIFIDLQNDYLECMEAFYKEDIAIARKVLENSSKLKTEIYKLEKENPLLCSIFYDLEKIRKQIYQNSKMTLYLKY